MRLEVPRGHEITAALLPAKKHHHIANYWIYSLFQAVLAETTPKEGKSEGNEKSDGAVGAGGREGGDREETLGDLILNNVVDQLLEGTLPSNSAANILVSSSHDDIDTLDVVSRPMQHMPLTNNGNKSCLSQIIVILRQRNRWRCIFYFFYPLLNIRINLYSSWFIKI